VPVRFRLSAPVEYERLSEMKAVFVCGSCSSAKNQNTANMLASFFFCGS